MKEIKRNTNVKKRPSIDIEENGRESRINKERAPKNLKQPSFSFEFIKHREKDSSDPCFDFFFEICERRFPSGNE